MIYTAGSLFIRSIHGEFIPATEEELIASAQFALEARIQRHGNMTSPRDVKEYFTLRLGALEHEVFCVMFVDAQNRLIAFEEMFRGTLTQTSVYPREIIKRALSLNAAHLVMGHNHPSGVATPSRADEALTQTLKAALSLIDVRVLDHIIVAGGHAVSMAEQGLM